MIENIRKYTGLMAVVFVLLGAGFLFTMGPSRGSAGATSGPVMLKVGDTSLGQKAYRHMGESTLALANEIGLHAYINLLIAPDVRQLEQAMQYSSMGLNYYRMIGANLRADDINRFIANRIALQNAMLEMGLYADEDTVTEMIKSSPTFSHNGKFDANAYQLFLDKRVGRLGMNEKDLREVVRESICLNKLVSIVGGGLSSPRSAVKDQVEAQNQIITLVKIVFNRDDFVEKENPTEEEVKKYWQEHQDAFKTEELRRITYALISLPAELVDNKPQAQDDKKTATEKDAAKKEAIRVATKKNFKKIQSVAQAIDDQKEGGKPLNFEKLIKEQNLTVVKTKLFPKTKLPKEIAGKNLSNHTSLEQNIFNLPMSKDAYDCVSDPLSLGHGQYLIYHLEEVIEPKLLDFKAAYNKARAKLIDENATRKVKETAEKQRSAILKLMKEGKSFDEAAKSLSLTPVQVGPFSIFDLPKDEPSARRFHYIAMGLNPGDVSETINENDRSLFFLVEKRELEDKASNAIQIDNMKRASSVDLMIRTFMNWLTTERQKANISGVTTKQQ